MLIVLVLAFGDPRAILFARVLAALAALCPCRAEDASCEQVHREVAAVVTVAAWERERPEEAAAALLGLGAHETAFRTRQQAKGGPARSWYQVEPSHGPQALREAEQARLASDDLYAAGRALGVWDRGAGAYACGDERRCLGAAAELRAWVGCARALLAGTVVACTPSRRSAKGSPRYTKGSPIYVPNKRGLRRSRRRAAP